MPLGRQALISRCLPGDYITVISVPGGFQACLKKWDENCRVHYQAQLWHRRDTFERAAEDAEIQGKRQRVEVRMVNHA